MRQIFSPARTPARASPAAYRPLWRQSRSYVTVSPYRWKYGRSGVAAARRRIISVSVSASRGSWVITQLPWPSRTGVERGRRRAVFTVSQVHQLHRVAGLLRFEQAAHVVESVHELAAHP